MRSEFIIKEYLGDHEIMSLTITTFTDTFENSQISLVAKFLNLELEWNYQKAPLTESCIGKKWINGEYPRLKTLEGQIFSSNSIIRFLARKGKNLYGKNLQEHSQIDSWLQFCFSQLCPLVKIISGAITQKAPITKRIYNLYFQHLVSIMKDLNEFLKTRQWLSGPNIALADLAVVAYMEYLFINIFDQKLRAKFPYVTSWFVNISHTPQFLDVYGSNSLCQVALKPLNFSYQIEDSTSSKNPENNSLEKGTNQNQQEIKFDSWMEKIKHQMINSSDKSLAIRQMFKQFDPTKYRIFRIEYCGYNNQTNEELKAINMRSNILAYLQNFRKSCFAVCGVYKTLDNYSIRGMWLFEGTEIPDQWQMHPLHNYHSYVQLDHENQGHQQMIESYWSKMNIGEQVEGFPVVTARYFA